MSLRNIAIISSFLALFPSQSRAQSNYQKVSEEVCYLEDASFSMAGEYRTTGKSLAEVGREQIMQELEAATNANKRICMFLLGNHSYLVKGFTENLISFGYASDGLPHVLGDPNKSAYLAQPRTKPRFAKIPGEGGTNTCRALVILTGYFQREGMRYRSLDGSLYVPPRKIVLHTDGQNLEYSPGTPECKKALQSLRDERIEFVVKIVG